MWHTSTFTSGYINFIRRILLLPLFYSLLPFLVLLYFLWWRLVIIITSYFYFSNCSSNATLAGNGSSCNIEQQMMKAAALVSIDFALCGVITCLGSYAHVALFTIIADRITRKVRRLAFSNILRQHVGYFDVHMGGELNTRLTQWVSSVFKLFFHEFITL